MEGKALEERLRERCEQAVKEAMRAVEQSPDGQWIAGSEWQVREAFAKLAGDCYRDILQERIDAASAGQAAFSPCGEAGGASARQGAAPGARAHRQRRG